MQNDWYQSLALNEAKRNRLGGDRAVAGKEERGRRDSAEDRRQRRSTEVRGSRCPSHRDSDARGCFGVLLVAMITHLITEPQSTIGKKAKVWAGGGGGGPCCSISATPVTEHPGKLRADLYAAQLGLWVCFATSPCTTERKHEVFPLPYFPILSTLRQWNFPLERDSAALGGEKSVFCSPYSVHYNTKHCSSSRENVRLAGSQFDRRRAVQRKIG